MPPVGSIGIATLSLTSRLVLAFNSYDSVIEGAYEAKRRSGPPFSGCPGALTSEKDVLMPSLPGGENAPTYVNVYDGVPSVYAFDPIGIVTNTSTASWYQ